MGRVVVVVRRDKMKKAIIILVLLLFTGCNKEVKKDRITIVTTLFPQYDFVREIVSDKADLVLLVDPGVDSHSYDLSPDDMITINNADLFIYTGDYMEHWVSKIKDNINDNVKVLDISQGIKLYEDAEHGYDPHIWTSPINASIIVNNIFETLCEIDKDNCGFYETRTSYYLTDFSKFDVEIKEIIANSKKDTLVFGSRFSLTYFFEHYGLNYMSVYDNCTDYTEPSLKKITEIIDYIKENDIKYIFYQELENQYVIDMIVEVTGVQKLLFHSFHSITKDELMNKKSYLSIMRSNIANMKKGLEYNENN